MSERGFREPSTASIVGGLLRACAVAFAAGILAATALGDELTAIADLKATMTQGMPCAANWNRASFGTDFYVQQLKAGHRLLPTVRLAMLENATHAQADKLLADAEALAYLNKTGVPIALTCNNIQVSFTVPAYRLPNVYESIPKSPLVWRQTADGLDQSPIADRLADPGIWRKHGTEWANSDFVLRLQRLISAPAFINFVENNEGADDDLLRGPARKRGETDPIYTVMLPEKDPLGWRRYKWSVDTLASNSLRLRTYVVETLGVESDPMDLYPEWMQRRAGMFKQLYDGFDSAAQFGWQGKLYTCGYGCMDGDALRAWPMRDDSIGYSPYCLSYDAGSPTFYYKSAPDFTKVFDATNAPSHLLEALNLIPAWEWLRARNDRAYRELSVSMEGMTLDQTEALCQWFFWSLREPGVATILRHYVPARFNPYDESGTATYAATTIAIAKAADRICEHETLRAFWLKGKPILNPNGGHPSREYQQRLGYAPYPDNGTPDNRWRFLDCDCNTPRNEWYVPNANGTKLVSNLDARINVYACATELEGRVLVFAWRVGDVETCKVTIPGRGDVAISFNGKSCAYWLGTPPTAGLVWSEIE